MSKKEYIVTSETRRSDKGYSQYCWMNISVDKLVSAASQKAKYYFIYHHIVDDFYLYSYEYSYDACKLLQAFDEKQVRKTEKVEKKTGWWYDFYLDYTSGTIFTGMGKEEGVLKLKKEGGRLPVRMADFDMAHALRIVSDKKKRNYLVQLIARIAVFAPNYSVSHQPAAQLKHVRRKKGVTGTHDADGNKYDSNVYPRQKFVKAVKDRFNFTFEKGKYAMCHVWDILPSGERSCYDARYFAKLSNLVMIPHALASLTDHEPSVRDALRYRVHKLYDFLPEEFSEKNFKQKITQKDWLPLNKFSIR